MKKIYLLIVTVFFLQPVMSQVLTVNEVIQEQDQWCWAGSSKCILDYYGVNKQQCEIAEYARTVITWYNFGTTNCCVDPSQGCNYWNYNWGSAGSIQDILIHFASIANTGVSSTLSQTEIQTQINQHRPFVIRWGWYSGGGHFVVGHGMVGSNVYYMNPWFGEGLHVGTYSWVVDDGSHFWSHTNVMDVSPSAVTPVTAEPQTQLYPNPVENELEVLSETPAQKARVLNTAGQEVMRFDFSDNENNQVLDISNLEAGCYFVELSIDGHNLVKKIIKK